jgi:hypothetical protein
MVGVIDTTTRARLAVAHLAHAISVYYGDSLDAVVLDAAHAFGASTLDDVHPDEHKAVLSYLAGRLSLPG